MRAFYNARVTVYVEVVLLNNLAVDALLIASVMTLRRRKIRKLRFMLTVAAGAAVAVAYAVLTEPWRAAVRIVLAPIMAFAFDKYSGVKDYIISLALFAALTFALGGTVNGIGYLTDIELEGYLILGIVAFAAFLIVIAVHAVTAGRGRVSRRICEITVRADGREIAARALCDSGNTLTDCLSGLPVMIVSEKFAAELAGSGDRGGLIEGFVRLSTVSGESSLPIVAVDEVTVGKKRCRAYAALSDMNFDGYEVILQNSMF